MQSKWIRTALFILSLPVFYASSSIGELQACISDLPYSDSLKALYKQGISYALPVISPDEDNQAQSGDKIFMVFFEPAEKGAWRGNLKKYGLSYIERKECEGRHGPEWTIVDRNGDVAVDCGGSFIKTSISY